MSPEELQYNIIDYQAGSTLVREGDEYGKLFVLLEGKCTVYTHGVEFHLLMKRAPALVK